MSWLVTGGAGYIGAHVVRAMRAAGIGVAVLDDLSTGRADRLPPDVALVRASVLDQGAVRAALAAHRVSGVVHTAGRKSVPESVADPLGYYRDNVGGVVALLEAMCATGVPRLVFSSSAAVYGTPGDGAVTEQSPTRPENPYGRTKLVGEWIVEDAARAGRISYVNLRYFNVAGAADPALADGGATNLVPRALGAVLAGARPEVFGTDHATRDGSGERDYVDVRDLAEAHVAAARLVAGHECAHTLNVGTGRGVTVFEVLAAVERVTGADATPIVLPRRAGDPPAVVARAELARSVLGWAARRDVEDMVRSAWQATAGLASPGPARQPVAVRR